MKRSLGSSDSLIPICPSAPPGGDEKGMMYRASFQPVYDGMDEDELGDEEMCSSGHPAVGGGEKKRRLSADQVRALEKNFEVENKLDPERKVRLAKELALQPRQVAVWFQNRRARWKTKQLERDYTALKSSYDALRQDFDALRHNNHSLLAEIKQLKAKLGEEESYSSVKEEQEVPVASESDVKAEEEPPALIYKDGSSDSDSSAVLNDDTNSPAILSASSSGFVTAANVDNSSGYTPFSSSSLWASDGTRAHKAAGGGLAIGFSFQHQLLKAEEHGYDEPCSSSFFSDEQPPSLSWYYSDQWSWMDGAGGGDHSNIGRREGPL